MSKKVNEAREATVNISHEIPSATWFAFLAQVAKRHRRAYGHIAAELNEALKLYIAQANGHSVGFANEQQMGTPKRP